MYAHAGSGAGGVLRADARRCCAARPADSPSPRRFRRCRGSSIACTTSAGPTNGSSRSSRRLQGRRSSRAFSRRWHGGSTRRGGGCSTSARTPDGSSSLARERAGRPKGSSSIRRPPRMPRGGHRRAVRQLNVHDVDASTAAFDAITLTDVLEHIPDPRPVLTRVATLLAPAAGWR